MHQTDCHLMTRETNSARTRRASLQSLGIAAALVLGAPRAAGSAPKIGKECKKQCRKQRAFCRAQTVGFCNGSVACEDALVPCCVFLEKCNAHAFFACFFAAL